MKRIAVIALALVLLMGLLPGCGTAKPTGGKPSIVCTIFPQYDWVRQILGDKADKFDLTLLLGNKVDLHSYTPSFDDMMKVSNCDLFVYVGGESDGWVKDALAKPANKDMQVIDLLEVLGDAAKEEEMLPGMQAEDEEEAEEDAEEEVEYDEHVWLSLKNAQVFCAAIADALGKLDPDNAAAYEVNKDAYNARLAALDLEYQAAVDAAPTKALLFGDRFPFRYFKDDYGLECDAAFLGCSAETEASFDTIINLARKVDALKLHTVMVIESGDQSIAKAIIAQTAAKDQQILVLDSMQSVTTADIRGGTTYLSIMESNLRVLKEALQSGK